MLESYKRYIAEAGYKAEVANCELDITKQLKDFDDLIAKQVNAIIMMAADSERILPALEKAHAAGIPIIAADIHPEGEGQTLIAGYVSTDNFRAGEIAGEYIAWKLKGKGRLAMLEYAEISPGIDRRNGVLNIIKHFPGIEVVTEQRAMAVPSGMSSTEAILQDFPELDAIWCVNDPVGLGALRAINAAGKNDQVIIVATDGDPAAVNAIRSGGAYKMTVAQFPVLLGECAVAQAVAAIQGREIPANVEGTVVPTWYTPIMAVTQDNIQDFPGWRGVAPEVLSMPWWK
jgi:ribose transport system substrate-binding protein